MFTDRVVLQLTAGCGGDGIVAWRREKYIPKGGPAGGDGGDGGSIIIQADTQLYSLEAYRHQYFIKAKSGEQGGSSLRQGKKGEDLVLKVPLGTLIKEKATGEVLHDLTSDGEQWVICKGGKGGKGNARFKSPTNRAPHECTPGTEGDEIEVELELKLIADIGLVGFPNAGKSTFLSKVTMREVKIAPYPFTTLTPNLGFLEGNEGERIWVADIPGLIEGAHQNKGLGFEFLRHVERTNLLLFVIDIAGDDARDPLDDFKVLLNELRAYDETLLQKPRIVALNKCDKEESLEYLESFHKKYKNETIFEVSALEGQGIDDLINFLKRKLSR